MRRGRLKGLDRGPLVNLARLSPQCRKGSIPDRLIVQDTYARMLHLEFVCAWYGEKIDKNR